MNSDPPFPTSWVSEYMCTLPYLLYAELGIEPRAPCMLRKSLADSAHSQPLADSCNFSLLETVTNIPYASLSTIHVDSSWAWGTCWNASYTVDITSSNLSNPRISSLWSQLPEGNQGAVKWSAWISSGKYGTFVPALPFVLAALWRNDCIRVWTFLNAKLPARKGFCCCYSL